MRKLSILFTCAAAVSLSFVAARAHAQTATSQVSLANASATNEIAPSAPVSTAAISNYFEVGVFGGLLWPSDSHALQTRNHESFKKPVPELGARVAYFPLSFLGAELEGTAGGTETKSGASSDLWAVRGHAIVQFPGARLVPFALIGGGVLGAGSNAMGTDSDKAFHFGGGAKVRFDDLLGMRVDLKDIMTQKHDASSGTQAHHPELTLGFTFTLDPVSHAPPPPPPPPADADKDGVPDAEDKCPALAGPAPEGCPIPKDSDGDGINDERDACPNEAGATPTGCPDKDPDHDCVPVPLDKCPDVTGLPTDGCPDPDPDHDGVSGDKDKCPTQPETMNGFEDDDGCPDTLPEKVKKYSGVVPGIEFDFGKATIRGGSKVTLDDAASVLKEYPALRISISGHTDNIGERTKNVELSKARADAVKTYLVDKGIDTSRIETRGAGPDEPIAENKQEAGRQKNRRIEFKLLQQ